MNATGNFKKKITADMLLNKGGDTSEESGGEAKPVGRKLDKEEKDQAVKSLLEKFA